MDRTYVIDAIKSAEAVVDESGVSQDLRGRAFEETLRHMLNTTAIIAKQAIQKQDAQTNTSVSVALGAIAKKLGVAEDYVHEVYTIDDGRLDLVIAPTKLDKAKSPATRQLALLVAAGRQAAGIDNEWTSSIVIRDVCSDFGRLDPANFAAALDGLSETASIRTKGKSKEIRINRRGYEEAGMLVKVLTGAEGAQQ